MARYCSGSEFVKRYDYRRVAQLVTDDGAPLTSSSAVAADSNVLQMLDDATADINSAVLVGKKYKVSDLDVSDPTICKLTASGLNLLQRICADLAYGYCVVRRALPTTETSALGPRFQAAQDVLEKLRYGSHIFDFTDGTPADAGLAHDLNVGLASTINNANSIVINSLGYYGLLPVINYGIQ